MITKKVIFLQKYFLGKEREKSFDPTESTVNHIYMKNMHTGKHAHQQVTWLRSE